MNLVEIPYLVTVQWWDGTTTYHWQLGWFDVYQCSTDVNGGGPGKMIDVAHLPDAEPAKNGIGTVHHVAMAIASPEGGAEEGKAEQLRLREELIRYGCKVTEVRDRCYFTSIYFREPGGTLFEVATVQPGFTADEAIAELGRALKLPPWEEPNREGIEAALVPVKYR